MRFKKLCEAGHTCAASAVPGRKSSCVSIWFPEAELRVWCSGISFNGWVGATRQAHVQLGLGLATLTDDLDDTSSGSVEKIYFALESEAQRS